MTEQGTPSPLPFGGTRFVASPCIKQDVDLLRGRLRECLVPIGMNPWLQSSFRFGHRRAGEDAIDDAPGGYSVHLGLRLHSDAVLDGGVDQ